MQVQVDVWPQLFRNGNLTLDADIMMISDCNMVHSCSKIWIWYLSEKKMDSIVWCNCLLMCFKCLENVVDLEVYDGILKNIEMYQMCMIYVEARWEIGNLYAQKKFW